MEDNRWFKNTMIPVIMLSLAIALRQMSMTIVMPFISTYCKTLIGYTPLLAGLVMGIFGLMQALFQIPFGIFSDRYGNKKMVLIGLSLVVIGLVIAYFAKSIGILIFARALQGSGAIIGVAYSWAAGLVKSSERTVAFSILSAFISAAAALAFALGPIFRSVLSVSEMFLICAGLLFLNELYILIFLKDTKNIPNENVPQSGHILILLKDKKFVIMNIAAFFNNYMMISVFYGVPIYLDKITGQSGMWKVFIPAIIIGLVIMKIAIKGVGNGYNHQVLIASFLLSSLSILFYYRKSYVSLLSGMSLFMGGYISIATITANNVNEIAKDSYRGTANGIFNSFQYIGSFMGSIVTAGVWAFSDKFAWIIAICIGILGTLLITTQKQSEDEIKKETSI